MVCLSCAIILWLLGQLFKKLLQSYTAHTKHLRMNWMEEVLTAHIHQGSPVPTSQDCCSHKRSTLVLTAMRLLFWRLFQVGLKCHGILWRSFSGSHTDILDRTVVVDELNELVKIKKKMARGVWMSFTFPARIFISRYYSFHKTIVVSMKWTKVFFLTTCISLS